MMILTPVGFRRLFLMFVATSLASVLLGDGNFSPALRLAYEAEPNPWFEEHLWMMLALFVPFLVVTLAGMVGMYRFRLWGRNVSLWSTLVGFVLYPFLGPNLSSPLVSALDYMASMLWGALLALAYFSPLSREFKDAQRAKPAIVPAQASE